MTGKRERENHSSFTHHLEYQKVRQKLRRTEYLKVGLLSRSRNERMELVKEKCKRCRIVQVRSSSRHQVQHFQDVSDYEYLESKDGVNTIVEC